MGWFNKTVVERKAANLRFLLHFVHGKLDKDLEKRPDKIKSRLEEVLEVPLEGATEEDLSRLKKALLFVSGLAGFFADLKEGQMIQVEPQVFPHTLAAGKGALLEANGFRLVHPEPYWVFDTSQAPEEVMYVRVVILEEGAGRVIDPDTGQEIQAPGEVLAESLPFKWLDLKDYIPTKQHAARVLWGIVSLFEGLPLSRFSRCRGCGRPIVKMQARNEYCSNTCLVRVRRKEAKKNA